MPIWGARASAEPACKGSWEMLQGSEQGDCKPQQRLGNPNLSQHGQEV